MLKMAQNYEQGTGAYTRNIQQAQEWYEKAAEAGSEDAQRRLANVLYEGSNGFTKDAAKDIKKAVEMLKSLPIQLTNSV
ncbi:MAG: SEL1-like repeat protein [Prevotella sp.]|nr:SEL1-like repeat protein [Prevotella sp.]